MSSLVGARQRLVTSVRYFTDVCTLYNVIKIKVVDFLNLRWAIYLFQYNLFSLKTYMKRLQTCLQLFSPKFSPDPYLIRGGHQNAFLCWFELHFLHPERLARWLDWPAFVVRSLSTFSLKSYHWSKLGGFETRERYWSWGAFPCFHPFREMRTVFNSLFNRLGCEVDKRNGCRK